MNEAIAASVILFHPAAEELKRNIASYLPFVSRLFIIDNTPGGFKLPDEILKNEKAVYFSNKNNLGIAAALNQAATLAFNEEFKWLLTMDQDSFFEENEFEIFLSLFNQHAKGDKVVAIAAPSQASGKNNNQPLLVEENAVITSGNLLNLKVWKELNGFDAKLFIDEVDHDFCYRAKIAGYSVIRFPSVSLAHKLGTEKETGYVGVVNKSKRTIHSPRRVYFMVRNYLYVRNKYKSKFTDEFNLRDKMIFTALKNNLFFSGHFFQTLNSIRKGYRDFKKNNFETVL